ncbi:MAG: pentapeptide repeat-containing protein [Cyanobacteria bacterium RM1_2_2]|nr:pentapeptide repeat-containing protein [Cyanobacteria bacterium RM1_2_2]
MTTLWKQLQADYQALAATHPSSVESTSESTSTASSLISLADFQKLAPLLEQGGSLFEILTFPLVELTTFQQPFTTIATRLLQHHQAKTQQAPTLIQTVTVLGQAAYLDQLRATFLQPKIQQWLARVGNIPATAAIRQQFGIVKALKLEEQDARQAIVSFPTSRLASVLNRLLMVRLEQLAVQSAAANQVAIRIALKTESVMLPALAQLGEAMQPWVDWYREDDASTDPNPPSLERHLRIDAYLDEHIAPLPNEPVFSESFSVREIYVPLNAQPLTCEGEPDFDQPPVALEQWALNSLNDATQQDQVLLVQGSFGRGKTTFCRLFADWVRQHQHPRWTPVLISLQEVGAIEKDFEVFLQQAVPPHLTQADPDWLVHGDVRFLFFLDGFSELHLDDQASSLEQFFQQVGKFQETCANHPDMGHRLIVTGRAVVLKTLERLLPRNLKRVEILPLDAALHDQWLAQWERLTGIHTSELKQILHHPDLPERSQDLMGEPLMLYFLAAMHRDGALRLDALTGASFDRVKFLLYQQIFYWALTKHRPGLLNRELSLAETEDLRRLLAEAGLWMVQTGAESVSLESLSERFPPSDTIHTLIEALQTRLQHHALTNPLVTFYTGSECGLAYLRFSHNSFGKLFASRRLHETLEDWSHTLTRRHRSEPLIASELLHWQLFNLLGCDALTPEITSYLMVLLNANPEFDLVCLFNRLEDFYLRWCAGQFVDAPPETFPQKEMRLMRQHRPAARFVTQFGQRQIDIYTGLNVMILLLQLHGYARSRSDLPDDVAAFYPCGRQGMPEFEPERLLRIIGYSHCVSPSAFRTVVGPYLNSANLSGVNLSGVNLSGVDLSGADLRSADLSGASLRGAILGRANLVGASLEGANLSNADLRGANMIGAYLRGADLSSALLSGADLSSANLIGASLSRADLRDADLSGAYLRGASLQSADLSRSYLIGASLIGACLSNANLSQVDLSEANLHGADLSEANLRNADLTNVDLIGADLNGASLCDAILCNASLNSADLIEADLCGADLSSANLIGADLSSQAAGTVRWSERTKWADVRGLEGATSVPEALKQQLGLTDSEQ